ncbi:MAG: hypothetical protein FWJ90_17155 [Actinomadura sp.]
MDELVLHRRSPMGTAAGTVFFGALGALLIATGVLQVLDGWPEALAAVFPLAMGGAFLFLGAAGIKARGLPREYALTPQGVRLSRGTDTFLLPASALREFTLTHRPLPRTPILRAPRPMYLLGVRIDPSAAAALPPHVARLAVKGRPGELRLTVIGGRTRAAVPVEDVRDFVRRHDLAGWPGPPGRT